MSGIEVMRASRGDVMMVGRKNGEQGVWAEGRMVSPLGGGLLSLKFISNRKLNFSCWACFL